MAQYVQVPDSKDEYLEFPDGMADDAINRAMLEYVTQRQTPQQEQPHDQPHVLNYTNPPERHLNWLPKPPEPVEPSGVISDTARTIARSTGRGLASTGDLLTRGVDWVSRNAFDYTPPGSPTPFTDIYDALAPAPVRGYETMAENAETYGPAIVAPVRGAASLAGGIAKWGGGVIRNAIDTKLGEYLQRGGQAVGEAIGGRAGQIIGDVAGTAGAAVSPTTQVRLGEGGVRKVLTDEKTPERVAAHREAGVPMSMGSVGNRTAQQLEDVGASIPGIGGKSQAMREAQLEAINQSGREIAEGVRGGPATGDITVGTVGRKGQEAVQAGINVNEGVVSNLQQGLEDRVGAGTVVADKPVKDIVESKIRDKTIGAENRDVIRERGGAVLRDRTEPVDPQLDAALRLKASQLEAALRQAKTPILRNTVEKLIEINNAAIDANTGSTYGATKDNRGNLRKANEKGERLDEHHAKPIYEAQTEGMRTTAEQQGVPRHEFDEIQQETAKREGEIEYLEKSEANREGGTAYNKLFSGASAQDIKLREILLERAPDALKRALGDEIELRTRGEYAAGQPSPVPENMRGKISEWWSKQNKELTIPDPALRKRMDALAEVDRIEMERPTRALPSKSTTLGIANTGVGTSALGGVASLLSGNFIPAAMLAVPTIAALASRKLSDPNFTERIVSNRSLVDIFDPRRTALSLHGAYPAQPEEERRPLRVTVRPRVGPPS